MDKASPETQMELRRMQLQNQVADALSRIISLERIQDSLQAQLFEKTADIQQLEDELRVIRSLTGVQDKLEAGAKAVRIEATPSVNGEPWDPMDLEVARKALRLGDRTDTLENGRMLKQVSFATYHPYQVVCQNCGKMIAYGDDEEQTHSPGIHDCAVDKQPYMR